MILPIGHEQNTVRRQPWVTFGLMALCVALFLVQYLTGHRGGADGSRLLDEAVAFYVEHPYLTPDPRLEAVVRTSGAEAALRALNDTQAPGEFAALEQTELDGLTRAAFEALDDRPERRWGLVPAHPAPLNFVTHLFLHGGWLHLLGNLLFLYLSGPFLEDTWGRPFFAAFYLAAGAASGGVFALRYPGLDVPLIGASGAIAGVMGAFLVRHWRRRIRFLYWFGVLFRGTFTAPAWAILPLYFLRELASAYGMDAAAPGTGGGGVAYWAHVGGFGFGVAAAAAVKVLRLEERLLAPTLEAKLTVVDNARLDRALERRGQGRTEEAWLLLLKETRANPGNPDGAVALWDLALELGRAADAAPHLARLLRDEVQAGRAAEAFAHWGDLRRHAPAAPLPLAVEVRLAQALEEEGLREEAAEVTRAAAEHAGPGAPAALLVRLARLAAGVDRDRVAALARAHAELSPPLAAELDALRPLGPEPERAAAARPTGASGDSPVSAVAALPLSLEGRTLVVDLPPRGRRSLDLTRVRAVSAAAVADGLFLDLLLDRPGAGPLRVLRIDGASDAARRLVPTESDPRDALLSLAGAVLAASGAAWLLGASPLDLPRFPSLADYETSLARAASLALRG